MRFGIICEGATDYITASIFLEASLKKEGIDAEFIDLHPGMDKTSELHCGWSNALIWLERNNPKIRRTSILGTGLFSNSLALKKCDAIIFLLDEDCLDDEGFYNFVEKRTKSIIRPNNEIDRLRYLQEVACFFLQISEQELSKEKHVFSIQKFNSESWCIGTLFDIDKRPVISITKEETIKIMLQALAKLEGSQNIAEEKRLKNRLLRQNFCNQNKAAIDSLLARSSEYEKFIMDAKTIFYEIATK